MDPKERRKHGALATPDGIEIPTIEIQKLRGSMMDGYYCTHAADVAAARTQGVGWLRPNDWKSPSYVASTNGRHLGPITLCGQCAARWRAWVADMEANANGNVWPSPYKLVPRPRKARK